MIHFLLFHCRLCLLNIIHILPSIEGGRMKKKLQFTLFISLCLFVLSISSAQIPNAGFENWTAGNPDNWITNNLPPNPTITQSADAHSGSSAMQGVVVDVLTMPYPPMVWSEFPISSKYGSLRGYYKFSPVGGDSLGVFIMLFNSGSLIAVGSFIGSASVSSYTQFTAPIEYGTADVPDSAYIEIFITSSTDTLHIGSTFKIDDLSFGPVTNVNGSISAGPVDFRLSQNYPNPFNPTTIINYQMPATGMIRLEVYDILGRTLATLVNEEKNAGQHKATFNGSSFTSGIYFYRINVITRDGKSYSQTNKMILTK